MMRTITILAAAATAALLTGCGGGARLSEPPPSSTKLLGDAIASALRRPAQHVTVSVQATAASADPQVRAVVTKPMELDQEGDVTFRSGETTGKVAFAGRTHDLGVRMAPGKLWVRWERHWFGPTQGVGRLPTGVQLQQAAATLRPQLAGLIVGRVTPGPEIDGHATWQLRGSPDPKLVADVLYRGDLAQGRALAPSLRLTLLADRDDHLIRELSLRIDVTPEREQAIVAAEPSQQAGTDVPISELHLLADVTATHDGVRVPIPPEPGDASAMSDLTGNAADDLTNDSDPDDVKRATGETVVKPVKLRLSPSPLRAASTLTVRMPVAKALPAGAAYTVTMVEPTTGSCASSAYVKVTDPVAVGGTLTVPLRAADQPVPHTRWCPGHATVTVRATTEQSGSDGGTVLATGAVTIGR
jgi:hypothetical protein